MSQAAINLILHFEFPHSSHNVSSDLIWVTPFTIFFQDYLLHCWWYLWLIVFAFKSIRCICHQIIFWVVPYAAGSKVNLIKAVVHPLYSFLHALISNYCQLLVQYIASIWISFICEVSDIPLHPLLPVQHLLHCCFGSLIHWTLCWVCFAFRFRSIIWICFLTLFLPVSISAFALFLPTLELDAS